jgi:hypothetical protein
VIENEYYIVDLPIVFESYKRKQAQEALMSLQVASAPYMKEGDHKSFVEELRRQADMFDSSDRLDKGALDILRQKLGK